MEFSLTMKRDGAIGVQVVTVSPYREGPDVALIKVAAMVPECGLYYPDVNRT